jgi:hypothetical protein
MQEKYFLIVTLIILSIIISGCSGPTNSNNTAITNSINNSPNTSGTPTTFLPQVDFPGLMQDEEIRLINNEWDKEYGTSGVRVNNSSIMQIYSDGYYSADFQTTDGKSHSATIYVNPQDRSSFNISVSIYSPPKQFKNSSLQPGTPLLASTNEIIYVVDKDGKHISNQTVYLRDILYTNKSSTGWLAMGNSRGPTDKNGTFSGGQSNLPMYPGDYHVFGASTDISLLDEDIADQQFQPGKAGYWKIITYDDILKIINSRKSPIINVTITVSNETGIMLNET